MSSLTRTAKRAKQRKIGADLTKKQARNLSKALSSMKVKRGELADDTKKLFDLISLFELTMDRQQADEYVRNQKFVVTALDPVNENPDIKVREGVIYFPIFGLQTLCMVNSVGPTTTIYILGNDDNKYLAVNTFMNFFDLEEQLKITGYYIAKELAAYFNSLSPSNTVVPDVELNSAIGEMNESLPEPIA